VGKAFRRRTKGPCGWLADKFGVSWQIVPTVLSKLLQNKDPEKAKRVMQAMLQMDKLDIARLEQA
jgi:predicted 3-demethylubiquinone-9 3-methyltransferase (glyoxalase superfamily)